MRDVVRVAVLDYGAANMVSITRALAAVGAAAVVAADPTAMAGADALVVPGVGAAGSAMNHIRERGLLDPVRNWVRAGRSCLGICLGFQLLFDASDEGEVETLGLLAGRTIGLADARQDKHGIVLATIPATIHGRPFVSAVAQGSLFGVQFHPEKSSDAGLRVLANFVGLVAAHRAPVAGGASMAGGAHSESGASTGGREPAGTVRMA